MNNEPAAEVAAAPAAANVAEVTKDGAVIGAYSTLEDAIAAATNGGTVTLLGDLSGDQVSAGKENTSTSPPPVRTSPLIWPAMPSRSRRRS